MDLDSELYELCSKSDDIEKIRNHIKWYLNEGLAGACYRGNINVVNFMISMGADGWDLGLSGACIGNNPQLVKLMIEKGANDEHEGFDGACSDGYTEVVKVMIEEGLCDDEDIVDGLDCALTCGGVEYGRLSLIRLLLSKSTADPTTYLNASDIRILVIKKDPLYHLIKNGALKRVPYGILRQLRQTV